MRSLRLPLLLAASAAVLAAAVAASPVFAQEPAALAVAPTDPFAHASSDVPVDEAVRFGVLPNGMQYAVLRNATPPGQASFRLRIDAGSLMERENQLGLAHFMEHMAFNGTTNIPENELTRIQERLGIAFGADSNAFTAFDQTVYMLDLPRTDAETVETSLKIMREQVSEALMAADAVDAERGVIEGEERLRNTPGLRVAKSQYELLARGQLLPNRFPIGTLDVIRSAPRDRFVEFYEAYYRPSRATFVAVGDFDVDQMEARIRSSFESWTPSAADGPEPDLGAVADRTPETRVLVEPGAAPMIDLSWVRTPDLLPDTREARRRALLDYLGVAVLNRRLAELARSDDPPFAQAEAQSQDLVDSVHVAGVSAGFEVGGWKRALEAIEQERRRLIDHGVTSAELAREVTEIRSALEQTAASAETRRTPALADLIVGRVNDGDVVSSPATDLAVFEEAVAGLTTAEVDEAASRTFAGQGPLALLVSPEPVEGGAEAVTAALEASGRVAVEAPAEQAALTWPYDDFGTPGVVVDRREIAELGATVATFANGVRLTVKPTAFQDEQVLVNVRTGIGDRGLPTDRPSIVSLGSQVFTAGGLGKLTADDLARVLSGKRYGANLTLQGTSWMLAGATRPEDLDVQLEVLTAYLTDPGVRAAPLNQLKSVYPQILAQQRATPGGAFALQAITLLNGGDVRDSLPSAEVVAGWTPEALKTGMTAALASGPIDVILVGDVTVDQAIQAVASTFGALAPRGPDAPALPGADRRLFPAGVAEPVRLTHAGPAEQALGYVAWPTVDQVDDRTEARRVALLTQVLQLRVLDEIREKQGLAYSPNVSAAPSGDYKGYGLVSVSAEIAPDKLDAFYASVDAIAAGLRDAPPSEDELNRARLPLVESLRRAQVTNEYWLTQLAEVAETPDDVQQTLTHITDLEAVTPADIQALARQYLRPETAWRASVTADARP